MPNPKLINFNNGEGLDYNDLNNMQIRMNYKLLDVPHYPNIIDNIGTVKSVTTGPFYNDVYNDPTLWLDRATFFIGSGACRMTKSGLTVGIDAGTLVIYDSTASPAYTQDNLVMFNVDDGDVSFALASNLGGAGTRYDALVITLGADTVDGAQTRDFKDATTGALTTQPVNKDRSKVPTFAIIQGTPGGGRPTIPADNHLVCFYAVTTSDFISFEDCMYPFFGQVHQIVLNPYINQGRFATDFNQSAFNNFILTAQTSNADASLPIPVGNPFRVLSVYLDYNVTTLTGMTGDLVAWGFSAQHSSAVGLSNLEADLSATVGSVNWIFDPLNPAGFSSPDVVRGPAWSGTTGMNQSRIQAPVEGGDRLIQGVHWNLPTSGDNIIMCSATILKY